MSAGSAGGVGFVVAVGKVLGVGTSGVRVGTGLSTLGDEHAKKNTAIRINEMDERISLIFTNTPFDQLPASSC